jgi:hypothetical protein
VSVVDQPEGLGLVERAADHPCVRKRTHCLLFPDRGVWFANEDGVGQATRTARRGSIGSNPFVAVCRLLSSGRCTHLREVRIDDCAAASR